MNRSGATSTKERDLMEVKAASGGKRRGGTVDIRSMRRIFDQWIKVIKMAMSQWWW